MTETATTKTVYETRVTGLWNSRHAIRDANGPVGVLAIQRNALGLVTRGTFRPEKGAVLEITRDPGLRRGQFSMWSEGREWLGSSERERFFERVLKLHTGGKPFHLVPLRGFVKGWGLHAPRTGESARIVAPLAGRDSRLEVFKRLDFPLLLFAYFLGTQIYRESVWPGPEIHPGSL